jgi:NADPH:quinone reductase
MRALRFDCFGDPHVLHLASLPEPVAQHGDAVIAVKAASVNPSDLANVAGHMAGTILPRVPGRDFSGVVIEGPQEWIGAEVWGTGGGDIGFTRDGSHAELLAVPAAALARKPGRLSFEEASAVGVNFVTAWHGAVEIAQLAAGENIAVFGVSGGVGGAVAQIARALGAHVIGVDRVQPAGDTPAASVIEEFIASNGSPQGVGDQVRRLTAGQGADVVYDAVGGVTTPAALASLTHRGRLVVISAVGTRTVQIDLIGLYRNETQILGCSSGSLDVVGCGTRLNMLTPYFESAQFRPLPIADRYSLDDATDAYLAVEKHIRGRVVICPLIPAQAWLGLPLPGWLPASGAPLRHVRALGSDRGVLAVTGVHPGAVRQLGEHPLLEVVHELAEPLRVVLGVAGPAREQRIAREQVRPAGQLASRVVVERDAAGSVAAQVDDGQLGIADRDRVAVPDQVGDGHRQRARVRGMGGRPCPGCLLNGLQRRPVVPVLVRGDDPGQRGAADQPQQRVGVVRGVDQQQFPGARGPQQIGIVVDGPDRNLGDGEARKLPGVGRPADADLARVSHVSPSVAGVAPRTPKLLRVGQSRWHSSSCPGQQGYG